ncbi:uncharacterized protein PV09_04046 [Verruconis gallopava]|uniref:Malate dehydrogenase n=1 Tax=Verruconis gallopava TaxID=253628 RepID=A0A0D2AEH6_9PEZI|nr:uncharacterized protein PV09_04046 [Verruconis gallopava]KIW04865.1 hypothetical protein PV09_04046 [Verruconis gallopava]
MLSSIILAALPLFASAAPSPQPDLFSSLAKRADVPAAISQCDLSTVKMNTEGLPPPSAGLVLDHIAIGRGTQNYTCKDDTDASTPTLVGALATLFNVTCMAGPYASLLEVLPSIAVKFPVPDPNAALSPANLFLLGHHYFTNMTTPFFNLNTDSHEWGLMACSKLNSTNAPNSAVDVTNLKLAAKSRDGCTVQEVYRLNAAGGQPPATCKGMASSFQVDYAAEYWFWSDPKGQTKTGSYS